MLVWRQFLYYIEFICRRACKKKIKSEFHVFSWFPGVQNLDAFLGKFTVEQVYKLFASRNNSLEPLAVGLSNSHPYVMEESRELRALISWVLVY